MNIEQNNAIDTSTIAQRSAYFESVSNAVYARSLEHGGQSYILPSKQARRYIVGNNAFSIKTSDLEPWDIFRMLITAYVIGADGVGTWKDTTTGIWYIDAIKTFDELDDATLEGKRNAELAIYDSVAQQEIRL